jgi:hypothetical protein
MENTCKPRWLVPRGSGALNMGDKRTAIEPEARRTEWLRRMGDEFLKLEPLFPMENFLPEEGPPLWVRKVEREVGAVMFPVAKIKDELNLTPRRMGALIGHSCAYGVWMMEIIGHELEQAKSGVKRAAFTPEQIDHAGQVFQGLAGVWYPALRRLAKRALCSSVDQPYEDMTEFLGAYAQAFARKPKRPGLADIGNPATEIYCFLLTVWRTVNNLGSVHELHQRLVNRFGPHRVGDLKRIEKMCARIGLHYRKPGRPKKAAIIQTP